MPVKLRGHSGTDADPLAGSCAFDCPCSTAAANPGACAANPGVGAGQPLKFTFWLERPLTRDEDVEIELRLPDENGGATFSPTLSGYLQAYARGEPLE